MSLTVPERLVERVAGRARPDRRGFLRGATIAGAALAVNPWGYLTRPASAYDAVCGADNTCADGYSVFCCTINDGRNSCPPNTFVGGWWKADSSSFCGGSARYYVDCNAYRDGSYSCRCNDGTCDQRLVACNQFRYGQCNTQIPWSQTGPVVCRAVSCTPPWQMYDGVCSASSRTDNNTGTHSAPCLPGPGSAPRGSLDSATTRRRRVRLQGWAFDPDSPETEIDVAVHVDGEPEDTFSTGEPRGDVNAVYGIPGDHGYKLSFRASRGTHTVEVFAVGTDDAEALIGTTTVEVDPR